MRQQRALAAGDHEADERAIGESVLEGLEAAAHVPGTQHERVEALGAGDLGAGRVALGLGGDRGGPERVQAGGERARVGEARGVHDAPGLGGRLRLRLAGGGRGRPQRRHARPHAPPDLVGHVGQRRGRDVLTGLGQPGAGVGRKSVARLQRAVRAAATGVWTSRWRAISASDAATRRVHDAEIALQREVHTPVAAARTALWSLATELPADARAGLTEPGEDVAPAVLADVADEVVRRVRARVTALRTTATAAGEAEAEAAAEARRVVDTAGFADPGALAARLDALRAAAIAAEAERDAAGAQVAGAERLDALVLRAGEMRRGFEALKDALADRAFVGFVVARRQRALLAHASKVLEEVTGRYAFTDDFRILDRESGLPRLADTLSGGETFLASLALALGLVEVADRSGGDLRALFLDEGFGSLDAAILDTALGALEERAKAGRLIGLISHVPTVAERIDTVLEIRSGVEGSSVHLLTAGERDDRVAEGFAGVAAGV